MRPNAFIAAFAVILTSWTVAAVAGMADALVAAAIERTGHKVVYDPAYLFDYAITGHYRYLNVRVNPHALP